MKKYFLSIFLVIATMALYAQDVRVSIETPRIVRVGVPFQMNVNVNADVSTIRLPAMSAFTVLGNRGRTSSSSATNVNGNITRTITTTFIFIVQANQEGTHEIGAAEATVGGSTYRSAPVTVQVVAGNAPAQQQQPQQQPQQGGTAGAGAQQINPQAQTNNRDLFVDVITDRRQVYQGEPINATLKIFTQLSISSINNVELPTFEGFFSQDIDTPPLRSLNQEVINGENYGTGVLRQYVLFPQRSGTLTISQSKMTVGVNQRWQPRSRSLFEEFFGGGGIQTIHRDISSRPVQITVLPLPEGRPASFSGGVGQMRLNINIDKTEVAANEAILLRATVSGTGNMRFVDAPRINFPPNFEVYDPRITNQLNAATTSGSRVFEYLIIPRHGGTYKIPSIEFSYFDPQARQYVTLNSEEYTITVERGEELPGTTVMSGISREDVRHIGSDINFIKTGNIKLYRAGEHFFGAWSFWLLYIVPSLFFAVTVYLRRKYIRKSANVALVKNRKANRYAAKRLKKARKFMKSDQKELFYEELSRALWGYLGDKLNIPVAELSKDAAKSVMEQRNVDAALAAEFTDVIDDCEFARYAPSAAGSDMNALYERAGEVINKMQKVV